MQIFCITLCVYDAICPNLNNGSFSNVGRNLSAPLVLRLKIPWNSTN